MKGGITSGVVYPSALWVLSGTYRFRNIGGASAGAIAAVIAAAAEYSSRRDQVDGRLASLRELSDDLRTKRGYIRRLFQPVWYVWLPFNALLALLTDHRRLPGPLNHPLVGATRRVLRGLVFALLLAPVTTGLAAWGAYELVSGAGWGAAPGVALIFIGAVLAAFAQHLALLILALKRNHFGLCPGTRRRNLFGYRPRSPALTEWLHQQVQRAAGRAESDDPLTFADLGAKEVRLQLITTDLSGGRPVRLPLAEPGSPERASRGENDYFFRLADLGPLLPTRIAAWLENESVAPTVPGIEGYRRLPGGRLPIALAARLSLSYPILLSAVPLHARRLAAESPRPHLFSDGGISSNFPIHFFDGWLPTRPTFGLDLIGPGEPMIVMPSGHDDPVPERWGQVKGLKGFGSKIFDSARNWHDTLQTELPGFRERICHIRLTPQEGGLNLNMKLRTIADLVDRGAAAGEEILQRFSWPQHLWQRYLILMQMLDANLGRAGDNLAPLEELLDRVDEDFSDFAFAEQHPSSWRAAALRHTQTVTLPVAQWLAADARFFAFGAEPTPTAAMRITPDV